MDEFISKIRSSPDIFPEIQVGEDLRSEVIPYKLNPDHLVMGGTYLFDGIRFTVPEEAEGLDLVWYFNAPQNWTHWYIVPLDEEEEMQGFKSWIPADVLYQNVDLPGETNRFRTLQTLSGENLRTGHTYLIWFRKHSGGADHDLRVKLCFAKPEENWTNESAEKALKLQWQPMKAQVDHLDSRGGRMLLDPRFFDIPYGKSQVKSMITDLRATQKFSGGFFITMETATPPCRTRPKYSELQKEYGNADFIQTASQKHALEKFNHPEFSPEHEKDDEFNVDTYYYDYFAFEVRNTEGEKFVTRVRTQASNYAELQPDKDGPSFGTLDMKNLTVFYDQRKEVGRIYYLMEGPKKPWVAHEPPPGVYRRGQQSFEYKGEGNWLVKDHGEDGTLYREIPMKDHQWNGTATGYFADGSTRWEAPYVQGQLEGKLVEYDENGEAVRTKVFKNGIELTED